MRILLTADPEIPVPPSGYGGIERIVDALIRFLVSEGHTVGLIAHPTSASPAQHLFGWPGLSSNNPIDTFCNVVALRRVVRVFRPDIVHSFSRLGYLFPLLLKRIPKIMSYQRHTGGRGITLAAALGRDSLWFTGCSEFICGMGRPAGGKWCAIPNFVETDKISFVPRAAADAPLLFLSRIESVKGPDLAIAVARASGRRLLLAGNRADRGAERDFWERAIAPEIGRNGIEHIGEVDNKQKNSLLGRAAALIVPIQWDEPFGIVFAEALAAGTPVITCPRGALPEIVEHGHTGFFMETIPEGVAAVRRLHELNRQTCRHAAETRFSVAVCAAKYLELYQRMIGQTPTPLSEPALLSSSPQ